jgi:hypothetical protein
MHDLSSLVCVDHRLQTVLRHAFSEVTLLDELMSKCVAIAARMHRSTLTVQMVRQECEAVGCPFVKTVIPVETRWNSKYGMVQSLNTIRAGLESLRDRGVSLGEGRTGPDHLSDEEWEVLKEVELVLHRFDSVSRELSGDKSVTLTKVLPSLFNLIGFCQRDQRRTDCPEAVKELAAALEANLDSQFPECGAREKAIAIGNVLHPYFKGMFLKKYGCFESTLSDLESLVAPPSPAVTPVPEGGANTQGGAGGASLDFFGDDLDPSDALMREMTQGETLAPEKSRFALEVESYLALPRPLSRAECDILLWWKDHEATLPLLSRAARYFLSVPASSASSERLWSAAGNIVTARRYSLDTATTEKLTFCQSNWQNLRAHGWSIDQEMEETAAAEAEAAAANAAAAAAAAGTPIASGSGLARTAATATPAAAGATVDVDSDSDDLNVDYA